VSTQPHITPFRLHLTGGEALETEEAFNLLRTAVVDRYRSRHDQEDLLDAERKEFAKHPSEMVRWLVIRGQATAMRGDFETNRRMVTRAIAEAGRENVAWTPLLDTMVTEGLWPDKDGFSHSFYQDEGNGIPSPAEWLRGSSLEAWVSQATDPSELARVLGFKAPAVWDMVARHGRVLTEEQVEWLLDQGGSGTASALWENPSVGGNGRDRVVVHFFRQYMNTDEGPWKSLCLARLRRAAAEDCLPEVVLDEIVAIANCCRSPYRWSGPSARTEADDQALLRVVLESPSINLQSIQAISKAGDGRTRFGAVCSPNATAEFWDEMLAEPDAKEWLKAIYEPGWRLFHPSESLIDRLLEEDDLPVMTAASLVSSRHISVRQLRRVARRWSNVEVREALAANTEARDDPEVREMILASRSPRVANQMIDYCTAEEFRPMFRLLARYDVEEAARGLHKVPDGAGLKPEDLIPLIKAEDQQVRLAAIVFLGRTEEREEPKQKSLPSHEPGREGR